MLTRSRTATPGSCFNQISRPRPRATARLHTGGYQRRRVGPGIAVAVHGELVVGSPDALRLRQAHEAGERLPDEFYDKLKGSKTFRGPGHGASWPLVCWTSSSTRTPNWRTGLRRAAAHLRQVPGPGAARLRPFRLLASSPAAARAATTRTRPEVLSARPRRVGRRPETKAAVRELGQQRDTVLACGGGTPQGDRTRAQAVARA